MTQEQKQQYEQEQMIKLTEQRDNLNKIIKKSKDKDEQAEILFTFGVVVQDNFKLDEGLEQQIQQSIKNSKLNQDQQLSYIEQFMNNRSCFKRFCRNYNGLNLLTKIFTEKNEQPTAKSESIKNVPQLKILQFIKADYLTSVSEELIDSNLAVWLNFNAKFPKEYCNSQNAQRICNNIIVAWKDVFQHQKINAEKAVTKVDDKDDEKGNGSEEDSDNGHQNIAFTQINRNIDNKYDDYDYSTYSSSTDTSQTWLQRFLSQSCGQQLLVKIPIQYFLDDLAMTDFDKQIENFDQAVDLIVYNQNADDEQVCRSAQVLYCLAHQRYVKNENDGMNQLKQLVQQAAFGKCPCLACQNQFMIPFSPSNEAGVTTLRSYCPKCKQLYKMYNVSQDYYLDGCVYGKDIAGLFMIKYPEYLIKNEIQPVKGQIYGFKLYKENEQRSQDQIK